MSNSKSAIAGAFFLGIFFISFILSMYLAFVPNTFSDQKEAIDECEKNLLRKEHCTMIAVPIAEANK